MNRMLIYPSFSGLLSRCNYKLILLFFWGVTTACWEDPLAASSLGGVGMTLLIIKNEETGLE